MSNIECVKCGMKAISKCPNHRSTFLQPATIELKLLAMVTTIDLSGMFPSTILTLSHNNVETMAPDLLETCKTIAAMPLEQIKQAICAHEWRWLPGCESSINCGCTLAK